MACSSQHSLLDAKKNSINVPKILYFLLAFFSMTSSAPFVSSSLPIPVEFDPSVSLSVCNRAHDKEQCLRFVSEVSPDGLNHKNGKALLLKFLENYAQHLEDAIVAIKGIKNQMNDMNEQGALEACLELMEISVNRVKDSVTALANSTRSSRADAHTWLSGVLTNLVTCVDELHVSGTPIGKASENLIARSRASLAMFVEVAAPDEEILKPLKTKLPSWVTKRDRKLLDKRAKDIRADLVVAKDSTGDFRRIDEAIAAAPNRSQERFVIYVKCGTYDEIVRISSRKTNLMIIGDGVDETIITGSLNFVDGVNTFNTPTLAAVGDGIILQDLRIENTAGPEKHQAVALRVGADRAVINRCLIDAYQDTLYPHSNRQFYRHTKVAGTVDFILGNAAVVIQDCKIVAKRPMRGQRNMITAQSRTDPYQNTATSIQLCDIIATEDLEEVKLENPTYFGRPWRNYARVVVMESYVADHIHPDGWSPWRDESDPALYTCYFAEYMNRGPGADTSERVTWPCYRGVIDRYEARKFTVAKLIQGDDWLPETGVDYVEGLSY